jgi:hypothetical protein
MLCCYLHLSWTLLRPVKVTQKGSHSRGETPNRISKVLLLLQPRMRLDGELESRMNRS